MMASKFVSMPFALLISVVCITVRLGGYQSNMAYWWHAHNIGRWSDEALVWFYETGRYTFNVLSTQIISTPPLPRHILPHIFLLINS